MKPSAKDFFRVASLLAVLAAGSCAAPIKDADIGTTEDPATNHPIDVQPHYHAIKLPFSGADAGLMPDDAQHFDEFVANYLQHGNGAISISAPANGDSRAAITYFGERLVTAGIPRERILVGTRDANDGKVELGYIGYEAQTATCGDYSTDLDATAENRTSPNLGCATQHNLAAMVSDPRDLVAPQATGPGDAARRAVVYDNYKNGKPTGATLSPDQSGSVSDVGASSH